MTNRVAYRSALNSAYHVANPTPAMLSAICPHLTEAEVSELFERDMRSDRSVFFAVPTTLVRNATLVYSLWGGSDDCRPTLSHAFSRPDFGDIEFAERAHRFAIENWGDELIADRAASVVECGLDDPQKLSQSGYPTCVLTLTFTTDCGWNSLERGSGEPESEVIDRHIVTITHYRSEASELRAGRAGYGRCNCARCGSGLGLTGCGGCKARFRDDQIRSGDNVPLPRKLVAYAVANGHTFDIDPEVAYARERERYGLQP